MLTFQKIENLDCVIDYQNDYDKNKTYPVIMFLHGAGTRDTDLNTLSRSLFFTKAQEFTDNSVITVAPFCSGKNTWFDIFETLKRFTTTIYHQPFTDKKRFYLMGNSMGGYGTWQLAMSMPEYFSAIVPICGGGMYWNAERLKNVPVWAFHGEKDPVVLVRESEVLVNAVNRFGGNAKLTLYPNCQHNCWENVYNTKEVFDWLLSNVNENAKTITNAFADIKKFG